ncbi:unnamed protein product [Clonostachys rhizophaga]|uniref:Uncharacterized protein n=1 Tax=Clonostachys rhizophaga TaxID=160324 RepID=A0A9N9YN89_9HYPO|nr:unnamed protein product [Clonostachys rhizophaga]
MAWPLFPTPKSLSGKEDPSQLVAVMTSAVMIVWRALEGANLKLMPPPAYRISLHLPRMTVGINKLRPRQGTTGVEQGCFLGGLRLSDSETH